MPHAAARDFGCDGETARLAQWLEGGGCSRQELLAAVRALSDAELMPFGLRAYRLNLLSLFGETWSRQRIMRTARAAAISKVVGGWEYHHDYLPGLTEAAAPAALADLPCDLVQEILARGRGLIVASFHLGPMRYLASDLAHAGIPTCVPLARDSHHDYQSARTANSKAALWKSLRIVNAEQPTGAIALAKTLAGGGCVMSTIDGNTGLDGPRGGQRRATVRILGTTARVKTGLFDMAARFGAPILVIIAHTANGRRSCRTAPVIDPGEALRGDAGARFVENAIQNAYAFFGEALRDHADEWCGGDLFHQWRLPVDPPRRDPVDVERSLQRDLAAGARLTVNHRRIVALGDGPETIWSDAVSGRCYKLPVDMAGLAERLTQPGGADLDWLDTRPAAERARAWAFLCQLASRDAIERVESAIRRNRRPQNHALREIARPPMHGAGM